MQIHQSYLLPVGERHFLVRGQLKAIQNCGTIWIRHSTTNQISANQVNANEVAFPDLFSVTGDLNSMRETTKPHLIIIFLLVFPNLIFYFQSIIYTYYINVPSI